MAREMYLVGVDEEELKPDPKPEPPKTFRGTIANFWYHYKWPTIFIAAGIALTIYIIYQFSVKVEPDYQIDLMVGESLPLGAEDALEQALMPYARDVNGDGQVVIRVDPLVFDGSQMLEQTNNGKLSIHLATGEVMFYIYESEIYDRTIGNKGSEDYQFLTPLEVDSPGLAEDGLSWCWDGDPVQQELVDTLPAELHFGVRSIAGTASVRQESADRHNEAMELLTRFIEKRPVADETTDE